MKSGQRVVLAECAGQIQLVHDQLALHQLTKCHIVPVVELSSRLTPGIMAQRAFEQQPLPKFKPSHAGPTFFHLPYNVRYRIYELAGLVRECPISLNLERAEDSSQDQHALDGSRNSFRSSSYLCHNRKHRGYCSGSEEPFPCGLLYVSRAIYSEASQIFYSQNRFKIHYTKPGGLLALQNLGPRRLSILTTLSIHLNERRYCIVDDNPIISACNCFCYNCSWTGCSCEDIADDRLLAPTSRHYKSVILAWERFCKSSAPHIQSCRLRLCLVCDTDNYDTAKAVLAPLLEFPTLKECSIRLSLEPDPELRRLAKTTTRSLTGPSGFHRVSYRKNSRCGS